MTESMEKCVLNCTECANVCIATLAHCLQKGGKHAEAGHIGKLQDCILISRASAEGMLRESSVHKKLCGLCAEACHACAESCEEFTGDNEMQKCAEVCRRCAESCKEMAK
jgi:hypothetical protein